MNDQQKPPWPDEYPSADKQKSPGWPNRWPNPKHHKRRWLWWAIGLVTLLLLTISIWQALKLGEETVSQECYTLPDPTSSWYSSLILSHELPSARPGDILPLNINGGYGAQGNLVTYCGRAVTRETNRTTIQVGDQRLVEAYLNDQFLLETSCHNPCLVTINIPPQTSPGIHQLTLQSLKLNGTLLTKQVFDLAIE